MLIPDGRTHKREFIGSCWFQKINYNKGIDPPTHSNYTVANSAGRQRTPAFEPRTFFHATLALPSAPMEQTGQLRSTKKYMRPLLISYALSLLISYAR